MATNLSWKFGLLALAAATAAVGAFSAVHAEMPDSLPRGAAKPAAAPLACLAPAEYARLDLPLNHVARRLEGGEPITIVAIGSSSTAGAGASSPQANYPSQLQVDLSRRFPGHRFTMLNRGVNGEETADMLARFGTGVIPAHPDLVLWQVGTNSVLRSHPVRPHGALLHDGVTRLKNIGSDIVLIDPQFAPKVLAKQDASKMVDLIALTAKQENVDLFHRFAVMRYWRETMKAGFDRFLSPDELHMNDWSYACVAKLLASAIAEAATRPVASAAAHAPR
jgi:lysophospholipase L1-like esterase